MYCVRCGVRLKDGIDRCPLCGLPAWKPEGMNEAAPTFPNRYPDEKSNMRARAALYLTIAAAIAFVVVLIVWLAVGKGRSWGTIALLGILCAWLITGLPLWIGKLPLWGWFLLVHGAAGGYVFFLSQLTGGSWFAVFVLPVLSIHAAIITTTAILLKYISGGRCYIWGATIIAYGGFTVLLELFLHLAFGLGMFRWSVFSAGTLIGIGLLLIIIGIVKPFKHFLHKNLFF